MQPFWVQLDRFAASGQVFSLETLISGLTFDIIGTAVLEIDLDSQHIDPSKQSEVIKLFRELLQTYNDDKNNLPWWLAPLTFRKRQQLGKRIDALVKQIIQQKHKESKDQASFTNQSRSIVALSLQDIETLTPETLSEISDQVRSFLFAGHDSNSSVLQWIFYELSRTPRALKAVRDELDEILGPDPDPATICSRLAEHNEDLFPRMRYINAVIKETLRLHPSAGTVRMTDLGTGFTVHAPTGEKYCLDGLVMYPCHSIIHRDPNVYGEDAEDWVPERWLNETAKTIPSSAWRPFERGPRNCIGIELANLESRIIIAVVARKYDFVKIGLGESYINKHRKPVINEKGQYEVKSKLYNVS